MKRYSLSLLPFILIPSVSAWMCTRASKWDPICGELLGIPALFVYIAFFFLAAIIGGVSLIFAYKKDVGSKKRKILLIVGYTFLGIIVLPIALFVLLFASSFLLALF